MRPTLGSVLAFLVAAFPTAAAEDFELPQAATTDEAAFARVAPSLARKVIERYPEAQSAKALDDLSRLQVVAGDFTKAVQSLEALRDLRRATDPILADGILVQSEIYGRALLRQGAASVPFAGAYQQEFRETFGRLNDKAAYYVASYLPSEASVFRTRNDLRSALQSRAENRTVGMDAAVDLLRKYQLYEASLATQPLIGALLAEDDQRRYLIDDAVMIATSGGATLPAMVFRSRAGANPGPAALIFNIYPDLDRSAAREAAAHGYVGVVANTRGKRLSPDPILPYEHEVEDSYAVIDWITRQAWSNGRVGMWGNSYSGFAQWAATKKLHPALKTIVPSAAALPGLGLPMENNVFLNANYGWVFYVTNNKLVDDKTYFDPARWSSLNQRWYQSGRPYRQIDRIDGTPNPLLQRWLAHPAYDRYWQDMVPYGRDYSRIKIPVLTITGYYDDGQISAVHYLREHYKYDPGAEHYLLIGPYQHFSAQAPRKPNALGGYEIDPVAQINTKEIIFQWMDHVLRGGPRPAILQDKINYEVMGANEWKHAPSVEKMGEALTLYLTTTAVGPHHLLSRNKPSSSEFLEQTVDLSDRKTSTNGYYYPSPIIIEKLDPGGGFTYVSEPFDAPVSVSGIITGEIKAAINKKDFDVSLVAYEVMPSGQLFHLSYFLGRASFARDMTRRKLLTPGKVESIPFDRTRLVSRRLSKGSRLLVVVNVNKNPFAQVNHGTGRDVSDESSADGKVPLKVRWYSESVVRIPIAR
jgi:putative CocE/NonD family hydrolase